MKKSRWIVLLSLSLVLASCILYGLHYVIFRDAHHIFIYMLGDVAFVPIEVLLVTVIVHQLLSRREMRIRFEKLNMVIGAFFSEVGTELLRLFSQADPLLDTIRQDLLISTDWTDERFSSTASRLRLYEYKMDTRRLDIKAIKEFLLERRDFLMRLLENPTLLEHESFTRLLRAVFHLTEELASRPQVSDLPEGDKDHLAGDARRSYVRLVDQWIDYMHHLKANYPYLFSLAMRVNPFSPKPSAIIEGKP